MPYSFPYICLCVFFLLVFFIQNTIKITPPKAVILIVPVAFLLFFGCRGFIGWDWTAYYPFYKELPSLFHLDFSNQVFDVGFIIYAALLKTITSNFHVFVFINVLIDVLLLHLFFKRYLPEKFYALGFALFLVFFGFVLETDLMRNIKSLLLFLLSLKYIEDRKFLLFLLFNLIGLWFHWSAIIFFPLYFFLHKPVTIRTIVIIMLVGLFVYIFRFEYIKPILIFAGSFLGENVANKINSYVHSPLFGTHYAFSIGFFERIFMAILILLFYNRLIGKNKSNILFINSFFLFLMIHFFFSEVNIAVVRMGNLFVFSYWIMWPMLIDCFRNNIVRWTFICAISCIILLKMHIISESILYQYDNVLMGKIKNYEERRAIFDKYHEDLK
jgi:hypothetical protein